MKKLITLLLGVTVVGCVSVINEDNATSTPPTEVPDYFNYETTKALRLSITTLDNGNKPLQKIPLHYSFVNEGQEVKLGTVITNEQGKATLDNSIPDFADSLYIRTDYIGLPFLTKVKIADASQSMILGGEHQPHIAPSNSAGSANGRTAGAFNFLGTYDSQGVPNNLEPVNDYIPQDLLDLINNTLPEQRPVPVNNPQYISENVNADTRLRDSAAVWVTFVHEGAGYKNTLGYYSYDLNNPPTTVADIKQLNVVFPNVSLAGSGGNLRSGNKVYLGNFPPNTGIGWFLIPNGWNGATVVKQADTKYSTKALNTFTAAQYRQHTVLLKDDKRELLLLGMEDISRPGGDNDFNDAVFFVTANPYDAVIQDNVANAKAVSGTDTDNDGVIDRNDKYPNDPAKAFDVFTPGENIYGSLAFEDLWPTTGDYDMNDLVVDYNFQMVTNTSNAAVEIKANYIVKAIGASFTNGFGFELPIASAKVKSVSGNFPGTAAITQANGTESGNGRAVVIIFDDAHDLFKTKGLVNTKSDGAYASPVNINVTVALTEPIKLTDLGYAPFNAFIYVNGVRGHEIHLPGFAPTEKADRGLLGTEADSSKPEVNRYYRTGSNLPWAINLPLAFDYPKENRSISDTHLMFKPWCQSGGTTYKDWYKNLNGYRKVANIYTK